jgi:hypothetical protein
LKHLTKQAPRQFVLTASALAFALVLSACGGGGSATPPAAGAVADTTPPTVSISGNTATPVTGPVTFTITASEALAAANFTQSDVVVTGGTLGAFTLIDSTHATIVVTPTPNSSGTITIDLPAGSVTDLAGNATVVAATQITQPYNTIPAAAGNTGTCATTATVNCFGFEETALAYEPFEGLALAEQANDPVNPLNKVGKLVKVASGQPWAGSTIYTTAANKSLPAVGLATSKIITLRVYSPAAGIPMMMKLEDAANGGAFMEKSVNTTVANAWETLSFDYSTPSGGSYSATTTYNKVSLFPNFLVAETADKTYYVDELKYSVAAAAVVPPAGGLTNGVFASKYSGATEAAWASAEGGSVGRYIDTSVATQDWWSGAAPNDTVPSFYFGYGISSAAKPWGFGAFVKAPANGNAVVSAYNNIKVSVWGNDELFNTHPTITVVLKGPVSGGCEPEIQGLITNATPGATSVYTMAKSSFTVKTSCPSFTSTDSIWAGGVAQVHFQILGTQVQYVTGTAPNYANGLNIGPINFQ